MNMLVDHSVRFLGRHFLFNSVVAMAVCLWGSWARWTELNRKRHPRTITARSPSMFMNELVGYEFTPFLAMHLRPWYKVMLKWQEAVSVVIQVVVITLHLVLFIYLMQVSAAISLNNCKEEVSFIAYLNKVANTLVHSSHHSCLELTL